MCLYEGIIKLCVYHEPLTLGAGRSYIFHVSSTLKALYIVL